MKKAILFGLALGILLFSINSVDAFHNGFDHSSHGTRIVLDFGRGDFYAQDYRYVDNRGIPLYRVYDSRSNSKQYKDFWEQENKRRAVRFTVQSYNNRYGATAGQSSGNAFCHGCKNTGASSNWGNKPAYNWLADGPGTKKEYYYKQNFDHQTQTFNWRY